MSMEDNIQHSSPGASKQETRRFNESQDAAECSVTYTSNAAEIYKRTGDEEPGMKREHGYCFISFFSVFFTISSYIICKRCHSNVRFLNTVPRGLGFQIIMQCRCDTVMIESCPVIDRAYEINRRIVLAMRMLGIGWKGLNLFCGIMDLGSSISKSSYYGCLHNIYIATKAAYDKVTARAADEEERNNVGHNKPSELTVSGDWICRIRGFSSLFGIATITGKYSKKVLDAEIKLSVCEDCQTWKDKLNTEEFHNWLEKHDRKCINHMDNVRKMKIDALKETFLRSEKKYGVKYATYIGKRDSETFKAIADIKAYGDSIVVATKQCVNNVMKRMGLRLRNARKNNKSIAGKEAGKLTGDVICHLTKSYYLAILANPDSVQDMKQAIWATYYHESSSDKNPLHQFCPTGSDSWCKWRKAEVKGKVDEYKHETCLNENVLSVLKPIYEDFTADKLLTSCLGANKQNNNETLNSLIWSFTPEHLYSNKGCIEIATYLAVCIFNEGYYPILRIMTLMGISVGQGTLSFVNKMDLDRLDVSIMDQNNKHDFFEQEVKGLYICLT